MTTPEIPTPPPPLPRGAVSLIKRLAPGWTHRITYSTGTMPVTRIDRDLRKRVTVQEPGTSIAVRLRHADGLATVAVWWNGKFEIAWRWMVCRDPDCPKAGIDHPGELPIQVNSRQLAAYTSTPDAHAALAAVAELGTKDAGEEAA